MEPLRLEIAESSDRASVFVKLVGEFDMSDEQLFVGTVTTGIAVDGHRSVVVDLADLTFIDSAGLRALVRAHKAVVASGARFVLARPSAAVERVIRVTGLHDLFEIVETLEDADDEPS